MSRNSAFSIRRTIQHESAYEIRSATTAAFNDEPKFDLNPERLAISLVGRRHLLRLMSASGLLQPGIYKNHSTILKPIIESAAQPLERQTKGLRYFDRSEVGSLAVGLVLDDEDGALMSERRAYLERAYPAFNWEAKRGDFIPNISLAFVQEEHALSQEALDDLAESMPSSVKLLPVDTSVSHSLSPNTRVSLGIDPPYQPSGSSQSRDSIPLRTVGHIPDGLLNSLRNSQSASKQTD